MAGPEMTPFILPRRWTFEMPKSCMQDYMNRKSGGRERIVSNYSTNAVEERTWYGLITTAIYLPLFMNTLFGTQVGKKKAGKCIMYLAADVEDKGKPVAMRIIYFWDW